MNIFIIPSWYPTLENPTDSIFFKEQAILYAKEYTEDNVIISRWGQGEFIVDITAPRRAFKKIVACAVAKRFENKLLENAIEIFTPAIEIRPRKYTGDIAQIVKANIQNFKKAEQLFGKINVIHAHASFAGGFVAAQLSKRFGIPYVLTEHMGPFPFPFYLDGDKLSRRLLEAFESADKVLAVSIFLKKEMSKYGVKVDGVIPNYIDDDFFDLNKNNIINKKFTFFALGRITKEKGIDTLLRAFAKVFKNSSDVVLKIGGTGKDMDLMVGLANELGIQDGIEWLGRLSRTEVRTILTECDIFVNASIYETFGVVVSEALCCGKPVISTKCGGVEDMVFDKQNGILIPVGNFDLMAIAMKSVYSSEFTFDSVEIRAEHLKKFSKKIICNTLRSVYLELVKF